MPEPEIWAGSSIQTLEEAFMPKQKTKTTSAVDENKLNQFIGQMLADLGGASSIALVRMGDAFDLYKTLHAKGPMTCAELAKIAKVNSGTCANGCPSRRLPTILPTMRSPAGSRCRPNRRWCLQSRIAPST